MANRLPPQAYQQDLDTPVPAYHTGGDHAFPRPTFMERLPKGDPDTDTAGSRPPPDTRDRMPYPMPDDGSDREG